MALEPQNFVIVIGPDIQWVEARGFLLSEKGGSPGLVFMQCQGSVAEYLFWALWSGQRG